MKTRSTGLAALLLAAAFACGAQEPQGLAGETPAAGFDAVPPDGEAAAEEAAQQAGQRYYRRVAGELAATGKPRELAFAATLLQLVDEPEEAIVPAGDAPSRSSLRDPRVGQWRRLASARAGSDVLANALLMQGDGREDAATLREAALRWGKLEPDNLAPVVFARTPVAEWLPRAGAFARFDAHYYEQARWMIAALRDHPMRPDESPVPGVGTIPEDVTAMAVAGILAAVAQPVQILQSKECLWPDQIDSVPGRRADCRQVARILVESSDTSLAEWVGLSLLRATASTPAEAGDAAARQRRKDWQMTEWGRLAREQDDMGAAQFASLLRDPAIDNEQALVARVLAGAGVPLDPPEGWRAPWETPPGGRAPSR
jgi:hypothetical protein